MYSLFCKNCGLEIGGNDKIFKRLAPELKCLKCGGIIENPQGTPYDPKKELLIRRLTIAGITVGIIAVVALTIFFII